MDKIEWFTKLAAYQGKDAPFGQPFVKGSSLYATDGHCILRWQYDDESVAQEFDPDGMDIKGFLEKMKIIYGSMKTKGRLDALLLKEMAGDPAWGQDMAEASQSIRIDGAFFYTVTIARALSGWDSPDAKFARAESKDLITKIGGKVHSTAVGEFAPLILTAGKVQAIILPYTSADGVFNMDFPADAMVRE